MSRPLDGVNVLALVPKLWPTIGTGNQRTTSMVTGMARAGARATAYVPEPRHKRPPYPAELADVEVLVRREPLAAVPDRAVFGAVVLGLQDRYVGFSRAVLDEARQGPRPDAVFVSSAPFSAFVAAARLAAHFGVPLVGDLRDEWARNPFDGVLGPLHRRLEERREVKALGSATALSAPIPEIFDALVETFPGPARVIEHGCDLAAIRSVVGPPPPLEPGAPLILVYAGMRYGAITEEAFVRTFAQLEAPDPVTLRLIGCPRPAVEAPPGLTIEVIDQIPHRELLGHYAQAHGVLNFLSSHGLLPVRSKFEEYKATGRPMLAIAPDGSRLHTLTSGLAGGFSAAPGDGPALAAALGGIRRSAEAQIDHGPDRPVRTYEDVGLEAAQLLVEALGRAPSDLSRS